MDAFAPASVTAVFAPDHVDAGSRGASVALEDGVTVSIEEAAGTTVAVDGDPADFEPVSRVLDRLGVAASVDVRPQVPLGAGFGASGAATLATALAANERFELGHARERLVEHSHEAEVAAGTGLGDVFVQDAGGLVYNVGDGRERVDTDEPVGYAGYGELSTADALADEELMDRVREEGGAVLDSLPERPTVRAVIERSWPFARALDLPTERVVETVGRVEDAGGAATMAMLGETVVAVDCDGVLPNRTRVSATGARLL
ncbi:MULTISPECIES: GHMP family kinase ATP-binding protein [Halolamina]|uniref:Pantoate kinase n=1 Tax=Halolamina pelagica TaxID=699431 RepID=A0A1I5M1M6_9EURY|nr:MULTISPECIES: GHMP kinase [Halolamina]NHX35824.1 GHMP kinase [Halolamina sp. R1-12]SFP03528.1 pantoate kinase [Halolamina pelagica]